MGAVAATGGEIQDLSKKNLSPINFLVCINLTHQTTFIMKGDSGRTLNAMIRWSNYFPYCPQHAESHASCTILQHVFHAIYNSTHLYGTYSKMYFLQNLVIYIFLIVLDILFICCLPCSLVLQHAHSDKIIVGFISFILCLTKMYIFTRKSMVLFGPH